MRTRRKIVVYIATSADGYIARPDGDVEWLNRRPRTADYGMREFYPTIDTILWGRKTYDWLLSYYKKRGKTKGLFDTKTRQLRVLAEAPKTSGAGGGVRFRAGEGVCAASPSDARETDMDDGRRRADRLVPRRGRDR